MSTSSQNIFSVLPGLEIPLADVQSALARMWESPAVPGQEPAEFRASQMNLIIHLGRDATADDALKAFEGALRFARRYPCRIILLCPEHKQRSDAVMTLKVFAECYVGKTRRDRSCCEALLLAYPGSGQDFLENQVSILLENDLPTYYWFHRFSEARNAGRYLSFLKVCKRIVYDSGLETPEVDEVEWPNPNRVRDLVDARLLPVRQSIGQFLSSFDPEGLARDLQTLELRHTAPRAAEARVLAAWFRERLIACAGENAGESVPEVRLASAAEGAFPFALRCEYGDGRYFCWQADFEAGAGEIRARLDRGETVLPLSVRLLSLDRELAEAFFF